MDTELPLSGPTVIRERGYNLDYLLVAATGRIVPRFLLRRHHAAKQGRLSCRAVGLRRWLPLQQEAVAMQFASAYWDLMRLLFLVLWAVPLIVLGIVDHTLLGGGAIRAFLAVTFGAMFLSAMEYFLVYIRWHRLSDTDECWMDADGRLHHLRLYTTKPYDCLISIGTGLFAAAMLLSQP